MESKPDAPTLILGIGFAARAYAFAALLPGKHPDVC
jgi:hypothetical protein